MMAPIKEDLESQLDTPFPQDQNESIANFEPKSEDPIGQNHHENQIDAKSQKSIDQALIQDHLAAVSKMSFQELT